MREPDPPKNPDATQPDHLLDELESIKDLLAREFSAQQPTDIPLLDDLVIDLPPDPPLLDIDGIFNDDSAPAAAENSAEEVIPSSFQFPKFTLDVAISDDPLPISIPTPTPPPASVAITAARTALPQANNPARDSRRNYNRELLIQELVDEFVPQIEAALHERLRQLDDDALQALKNTD